MNGFAVAQNGDTVADGAQLFQAFKELIGQVCGELVRRGAGARRG